MRGGLAHNPPRPVVESGETLGVSWAVLGRSWAALGGSWALFGGSWEAFGPSRGGLGLLLGTLGPSWKGLGGPLILLFMCILVFLHFLLLRMFGVDFYD